jgi:hypothetical protein
MLDRLGLSVVQYFEYHCILAGCGLVSLIMQALGSTYDGGAGAGPDPSFRSVIISMSCKNHKYTFSLSFH